MSTMPSVGSGTYSPGPNMVCSPEQEKVGTSSIEAIICPVYSDLRIRATVSRIFTPALSIISMYLDIPLHIYQVDITELRTNSTQMSMSEPFSHIPLVNVPFAAFTGESRRY